jgi:hypothetical protein
MTSRYHELENTPQQHNEGFHNGHFYKVHSR